MKSYSNNNTAWSKKFFVAAMTHASIAIGLTMFLVISQASFLEPAVSRVIAAGGAGTWFTLGYTMYIIVGIMVMSAYGLFYYYTEAVAKQSYSHIVPRLMAWGNFVLINAGTIAAMGMLMYGGYSAGASMLPTDVGGKGFSASQAHNILGPLAEPISMAILVTAAGALMGILGFVTSHFTSRKNVLTIEQRKQRTRGDDERNS